MAMCFSENTPEEQAEFDRKYEESILKTRAETAEFNARKLAERVRFLEKAPHFQVKEERVVNGKSILLVHYEGCSTFNGMKLMLLKRRYWPGECLDPHLLGEDYMIMARFEPNEMGWRLATACAEMIRL